MVGTLAPSPVELCRDGVALPTLRFGARLPGQTTTTNAGEKLPMNRRELLRVAAALPLASTALSRTATAQAAYPNRNITMIVPFPAGGQADLAARPVAAALER